MGKSGAIFMEVNAFKPFYSVNKRVPRITGHVYCGANNIFFTITVQ